MMKQRATRGFDHADAFSAGLTLYKKIVTDNVRVIQHLGNGFGAMQ